jgi:peptidoglycan/LPS O-acetylase OafA/YrhL
MLVSATPFFMRAKALALRRQPALLTINLLQSWFPQAALTWSAVCWSLSVEAFFYLVFPILLVWSKEFMTRNLFGLLSRGRW